MWPRPPASARPSTTTTGTRHGPAAAPATRLGGQPTAWPRWRAQDVLLVTGGGKGITAECALALAARPPGQRSRCWAAPTPADDQELAANLARMAAAGVTVRYVRADITDPRQMSRPRSSEVAHDAGAGTAMLHGAGRNEPAALASLDRGRPCGTRWRRRSTGLGTVLAAVDPAGCGYSSRFGSIIGRAGLRGEADYAIGQRLAHRSRPPQSSRSTRTAACLALEWSVWSGVGMGERLGVLESLIREGIQPIPPDEGVAMLRRLVADPDTAHLGRGDGPGRRPAHHHPRACASCRCCASWTGPWCTTRASNWSSDAELSAADDLYLADHELDGDLLFPAVFGMEAMAQVARGADRPVRAAAPRGRRVPAPDRRPARRDHHDPGRGAGDRARAACEVVIRSSETAFAGRPLPGHPAPRT